jgi:isoleucyl-tRNA synthetase
MFKKLDNKEISKVEAKIVKEWKKMDILKRSIETRKNGPKWVFYDGPIYANAKPGIHHVFAKTIKDAFCKYKTMQGYRVDRKIGLDTHGLPIEVNVEKKLGFKNKGDIENFGIENFCKECNKETATNIDEIKKVTDMMGQFIDQENPYITCVNDYHETEWYLLKEMHKKGAIYQSNKILPYCPRCGTELAKFEVDQGYQEDAVNTVIVPFKLVDKDEYLLVWTTTPWTLMDNVAACVNPDMTYIKAESMGYKFILAESLANNVLGEDYKVLETFKGIDLKGLKYEQLMPFATVEGGKSFEVVADEYVTDSDGTGIVHIAPAYGEDDNRVCKENGIGWTQSVDLQGKYTIGPWKGTLVTDKDLEIDIIKYLKENDKLFKKIKITHDYPHCWRCKSPLIYYAKSAWYIKTTDYKDQIIKENNKVNWYPDYVGEKRFGNWLENMVDWGISRNRYWGCPLPFWVCDECGEFDVIGSREELISRADQELKYEEIDMHRPYVDDITMKCPKCGKTMHRVKDVIDVWFDSGAMPYAQCHYPFENKEWFESHFPAEFIAEGVDQTRGWFYTLLVISTIISGQSSFKNVVVNDMMLDAEGKKMSKSVGNIIDPVKIMEEYGADIIRWYMLYASPVWTPLKFDYEGLREVHSKFYNTLRNTYSFFALYANIDKIDPREYDIDTSSLEEIDKWLLSKYNKLVRNVTNYFEEYDLHKIVREITAFVSEDLSNWYIRRNRNRFWGSSLDDSKKAVYITTYEVLVGLSKIIAPIIPFLSDEIYTKLTNDYSVHTSDFPTYDKSLIDIKLEEKMDYVRNLISMGRMVREEAKIKVRTPLSEAIIDSKVYNKIKDLIPLIKEELNVKEVVFVKDLATYMNFNIKPNFKEVGKTFGPKIKAYSELLLSLSREDETKLLNNENIVAKFEGEDLEITPDMVDIRIEAKEGFNVGMQNNKFVILNTEITDELYLEGLAREIVSKVQNLRKEKGFEIMDRITLYYSGDEDINKCFDTYKELIASETLATDVKKEVKGEEVDINSHKVTLDVEKN